MSDCGGASFDSWDDCGISIDADSGTDKAAASSCVGACDGSINAIRSSIASAVAVGAGVLVVVGQEADADTSSGASDDTGVSALSGSSVIASITTVPANGAGRSSASQIKAGARRSRVKLCDQPLSLVATRAVRSIPSLPQWHRPTVAPS